MHKGGGKSRQDRGNYRPIAIMNTLAKTFGWVINDKMRTWIENSRVLGEEQSGLENVLVMKEVRKE